MNTVTDEASLRSLLEQYRVPINTWGTGSAQNVSNLLREIQEGESILVDNFREEIITRILRIVKMHISDPGAPERGNLLEWTQTFSDGRVRWRKQMPSGKIKSAELPEATFLREMQEELELVDGYNYNFRYVTVEPRASPSYPGLKTEYHVYHFDVLLHPGSPALRDEFDITCEDPEEGTLHFRWEHPGKRKKI